MFSLLCPENAELERGAPRLVINYKPLNKVLEWIRYPIPNKRDLINKLSDSVIFSKFDKKSGFWQIQIRKKDKYKTAFIMTFDLSSFCNSISNYSIYWICSNLLFNSLNKISKYFSKMFFKHNVISEFWIDPNLFIFQDKMTPPKPLSSTQKKKREEAKSAKILKKWNFPPEIQNLEHLTLIGKGIAKVDYADGPAESLQKVSQQIEFFNLENPKRLTPAKEGTAKVVKYAERPAERLQKKPQQIEFFNLVNPKRLTPAKKGKAKVNEYEESQRRFYRKFLNRLSSSIWIRLIVLSWKKSFRLQPNIQRVISTITLFISKYY
jgi:hypothetical protein